MKKDIKNLSVSELGKLFPIRMVEYNPQWPAYFEVEKVHLLKILKNQNLLRIVHFGSTAVPKLAAKPIIDILVEIADQTDKEAVISKMTANGYSHMKNHPTHLMFVKGYHKTGYDAICYHIHMGTKEEGQLWERLLFKDYLCTHWNIAKEYEELKFALAKKHKYNREDYTEAKTGFVKKITALAKKA